LLFAYGESSKTEIEEQRSDDSEASGSSTQEGFECKMFLLYRVNEDQNYHEPLRGMFTTTEEAPLANHLISVTFH
jgi:hypothetical protein